MIPNHQKNSEITEGDDGEDDDSECYVHSQSCCEGHLIEVVNTAKFARMVAEDSYYKKVPTGHANAIIQAIVKEINTGITLK